MEPKKEKEPARQTETRKEPEKVTSEQAEEEKLEDELDLEDGTEEDEEVAWVPKKEAPKPVVVDTHASPQPPDLREEVFECNYTNPRSDFCVMKGDVQVREAVSALVFVPFCALLVRERGSGGGALVSAPKCVLSERSVECGHRVYWKMVPWRLFRGRSAVFGLPFSTFGVKRF